MAVKTKLKCPKCDFEAKNEMGLNIHHQRIHTSKGKTWGRSNLKQPTSSNTHQLVFNRTRGSSQILHDLLKDKPEGMQIQDLAAELKKRRINTSAAAISQRLAKDSEVIKISRGVYCLRDRGGEQINQPAPKRPEPNLPREALLVRIEQLEAANAALVATAGHLLRGVSA